MDDARLAATFVAFHDLKPEIEDFETAVVAGLSRNPKSLPCKFFYDERGSILFDRICELEEYYPTRTEIGLLERHGEEIAALVGSGVHLIELGSGASVKIRTLLDSMPAPSRYTAVDISREHLLNSAGALSDDYPHLDVAAVCADYTRDFEVPGSPGERRVAFFPGSTIGNFAREEAAAFAQRIAGLVQPGGGLLVGVDLKKDTDILRAAYNDSEGVTAAFNLNLLWRINEELGGNFDVAAFRHEALYNDELGRIEMHLFSERAQEASVSGHVFRFAEGESIHTENSHKFSVEEFRGMCAGAGFRAERSWVDDAGLFSVHYFTAV